MGMGMLKRPSSEVRSAVRVVTEYQSAILASLQPPSDHGRYDQAALGSEELAKSLLTAVVSFN